MWFRRRRPQIPLFMWFLALLGLRNLFRFSSWRNMSEEGKQSYRRKRHEFLRKLDEAYSVWDQPDEEVDSES
ncbi:MAG: hypothetical protein M1294_13745 [Firmicutes bacterium]|jgi:hypothetical protein|uniref:Uncharacterized protein n=1 Tax=Sulfobacillus benefaciens TaxID=453960 RepID=A0A2T2WTD7_9FIRM|nr:hypothetical protein [Bacillota bacterium]MCL5015543.1 hypothetical protein [Bacillota bacterium]PSR25453.1 MAG: hypothetical protein C7B43_16820 [Sulfobacillus benefaciens]HBQ94412.1 hypothetical protein [Sulfobacillus sp.]